ncbi:MAG: alpha/beta hydrolase [Bacteroidota bacterium]
MKPLKLICLGLFIFLARESFPQHSPTSMQDKSIQITEARWNYTTSYHGKKALLFIHGANSSSKIWKYQYELELKGYKNIYVDLLGYGESEKPQSGYSLEKWIRGLKAILDKEELEEVHIVAHSNGVILAKEFYREFPEKVEGLILLDGMLKAAIPKPMLSWMKSSLERSDYEEFMRANLEHMPTAGLREIDKNILKEDALDTPLRIRKAELELVGSEETWREIEILCPTSILHSNNPMWTKEYMDDLQNIAPGHTFILWEDAGHFLQLQYPSRLNELIREIISLD